MTDDSQHPTPAEHRPSGRAERPETTTSDGRPLAAGLSPDRVARVAVTLCFVALLAPFAVFAVPQLVGADHGFVILSGSMEPHLSPGDVVIVGGGASAQVGDVITFTTGGAVPVTHRVVGVEDGRYVTKGDANENADSEPVAPSAVLGRVVLTIPLVGHVILWANTPLGQVALVVVPLVLLGASSLSRWSREAPPVSDAEPADDATALAAMFESVDARPTGADAPGTAATEPKSGTTVAVAAPDLTLTLVAAAVVCGYAGWNVSRELASVGAPHPVSVAVLTAGVFGVLFAAWTLLGDRQAVADAAGDPPTAADGGVEPEDEP